MSELSLKSLQTQVDGIQQTIDNGSIGSGGTGGASINDTTISPTTTWSSQKINLRMVNEIEVVDNKIDLVQSDVNIISADVNTLSTDISNLQTGNIPFGAPNWNAKTLYNQNNIVVYNGKLYRALSTHTSSDTFLDDMKPWATKWESLVGSTGTGVQSQLTKLGVNGNTTTPQIIQIPIAKTLDFNTPRVNILKFQVGTQNVVQNIVDFNNSDAGDFLPVENVLFDGKMHLQNNYETIVADEGILGQSQLYSCTIDKSNYKKLENVSMDIQTLKTTLKCVPFDKLIMPTKDINISNASSIDYFNVSAVQTGNGKLRIITSVDAGQTWKTFNGTIWESINPTIEEVKANGMSIDVFNNVTTPWNELSNYGIIRFAYLLSQESVNDVVNTDLLKFQYDGQGIWKQAKESEYDVQYTSNESLEILIYFSGDIKINYVG